VEDDFAPLVERAHPALGEALITSLA